MPAVVARARAALAVQRRRHPVLDHAVSTVEHYDTLQGATLAGAITYFGFLSLFPLIALAYLALSWVARLDPGAQDLFTAWLTQNLPGLAGPDGIDLDAIATGATSGVGVGLGGVAGLVYSGIGCLDALRTALRRMWAVAPEDDGVLRQGVTDLLLLVLLGTTVLVATAASAVTTASTAWVLDLLGLAASRASALGVQALAVALPVLADFAVLLVVFGRLPRHAMPWRNTWTGALLGAVGVEVLKQLATVLLAGTSSDPVYGAFAGLVTVLVWINLVSRVVVYAAAWVVTGPVPTVEAEVGARGETLDAAAADAVEEARRGAGSDRVGAPVARPHVTTAGSVGLTTTGIDRSEGQRGAGVPPGTARGS